MNQNYYIGLDIGTNSVGWAVTDERYNLIKAPVKGKYKNHDMWGIRLFESANPAEERRMARSNRRRGQRKIQRIKLLQELFSTEMNKVDPTFFIRLNESKLHPEDKSSVLNNEKHLLFVENENAEKEYYDKYPTIYHLRKELIDNDAPHDIRLVYLALHHIIKNRGHFLREGSLSDATNFDVPFELMLATFDALGIELKCKDKIIVEKILADSSVNNTTKQRRLAEQFEVILCETDDSTLDNREIEKKQKLILAEITKLMAGNKGSLSKIFGTIPEDIDGTKTDVKLSEEKYELEIRDNLISQFPEEINAIDRIKELYDWSVLQDILPGTKSISEAKVAAYQKHQDNLRILKKDIFRKYLSQKDYNDFFRKDIGNNYVSYVGLMSENGKKVSVKKCKEEDFYLNLKKILDKVKDKAASDDVFLEIYQQVENHSLLPLQRSKDNGVIPRQVHEYELKKILDNASKYLPFLNEIDENALSLEDKSVKGKIISIFEYRIPYYVGPLSTRHQSEKAGRQVGSNAWIIRRPGMEQEYIYPWNFDDVVDKERCNEAFIARMTNKCTYLVGEDVLPKNSLLYKKYTVLNELNNLKVYGKEITVQMKQSIYENLFKKKAKVSGKNLLSFLQKEMNDPALTMEDLSGFDQNFASNLSSYLDFRKKVFNDEEMTFEEERAVETIIKWITIYGDDSSMIRKMVKSYYGDMFSNEQIAQIARLRYSGWGNFSRKFLTEVRGMVGDEYGTLWSIIEAMWDTNENLMQLLSNKYKYIDVIDEINSQFNKDINEITYENIVQDLFVPPANKRAIWQTIQIVEEIQKIMKYPAKKIFVEMARGEEKEKKRTISRKQKLIDLYKQCDKDVREWGLAQIEEHEEKEFNSIKLYLYFLQQGKCAYTGNPINLADLMAGNSKWDRDHIYPQSKIKDDSLDNLVLVERQKNAKKDNGLISREIQKKMEPTWRFWYNKGFITKEKYDRLVRRDDFKDDELSGFIARQLVETRQTTKVVADVLKQIYDTNKTKIVYVKAALVSDFRKDILGVLKSRSVNDYHHAKDAYLNIVVGNVYNIKFTDNPWNWMRNNREKVDSGKISFHKTMCFDVTDNNNNVIWKGCNRIKSDDGKTHFEIQEDSYIPGNKIFVGGDVERVREIVRQNTCMYTEYTYCSNGALFNASHERKGSNSATIRIKDNLSIEKYGGYKSANTSYFALVEFDGKKGQRVRNIIGVPIYVANMLEYNENAFVEYCTQKGMTNVIIVCPKIKKNALIIAEGYIPMRIRGENSNNITLKNNIQLKTNIYYEELIRRIEKVISKNNDTVDTIHDGVCDMSLIDLYDSFIIKLEDGIYRKRPGNQYNNLKKQRDLFLKLSLKEKCIVLNQILIMMRCDINTQANLKLIDGSTNSGNIAVNKNTLCNGVITIVNQSVTGLYENREKY